MTGITAAGRKPSRYFPVSLSTITTSVKQIRGRTPNHPWGDVGEMAPAGASFDDSLRPGCKTFNIDGYVDYIVARIRAQRNQIVMVVPSGLERTVDARTIELQRKAYAAI